MLWAASGRHCPSPGWQRGPPTRPAQPAPAHHASPALPPCPPGATSLRCPRSRSRCPRSGPTGSRSAAGLVGCRSASCCGTASLRPLGEDSGGGGGGKGEEEQGEEEVEREGGGGGGAGEGGRPSGFKFRHKSKQILSPPRAGLQRGSHLAPFMCPNMGWDSRRRLFPEKCVRTLVSAAAQPSPPLPPSACLPPFPALKVRVALHSFDLPSSMDILPASFPSLFLPLIAFLSHMVFPPGREQDPARGRLREADAR